MGQSEISVSDMVDVFLLAIPPAAGDELQVWGVHVGYVCMGMGYGWCYGVCVLHAIDYLHHFLAQIFCLVKN